MIISAAAENISNMGSCRRRKNFVMLGEPQAKNIRNVGTAARENLKTFFFFWPSFFSVGINYGFGVPNVECTEEIRRRKNAIMTKWCCSFQKSVTFSNQLNSSVK